MRGPTFVSELWGEVVKRLIYQRLKALQRIGSQFYILIQEKGFDRSSSQQVRERFSETRNGDGTIIVPRRASFSTGKYVYN